MSLHRRTLLRAVGTTSIAAALAGCSGATDETTSTTARDTNGTTAASDTATATQRTRTASSTDADTTTSTTGAGNGYDPTGGPNVVDAVPETADHVVELTSSSFEPETVSVGAGDTVAFDNADEAVHTVTAKEDAIPETADYWASGNFETQAAAESGFDDADGVLTGGRVYVHTFETVGTHEYYCIPHSHIQMAGTVVVEAE